VLSVRQSREADRRIWQQWTIAKNSGHQSRWSRRPAPGRDKPAVNVLGSSHWPRLCFRFKPKRISTGAMAWMTNQLSASASNAQSRPRADSRDRRFAVNLPADATLMERTVSAKNHTHLDANSQPPPRGGWRARLRIALP
jgi:hypothetical protein